MYYDHETMKGNDQCQRSCKAFWHTSRTHEQRIFIALSFHLSLKLHINWPKFHNEWTDGLGWAQLKITIPPFTIHSSQFYNVWKLTPIVSNIQSMLSFFIHQVWRFVFLYATLKLYLNYAIFTSAMLHINFRAHQIKYERTELDLFFFFVAAAKSFEWAGILHERKFCHEFRDFYQSALFVITYHGSSYK